MAGVGRRSASYSFTAGVWQSSGPHARKPAKCGCLFSQWPWSSKPTVFSALLRLIRIVTLVGAVSSRPFGPRSACVSAWTSRLLVLVLIAGRTLQPTVTLFHSDRYAVPHSAAPPCRCPSGGRRADGAPSAAMRCCSNSGGSGTHSPPSISIRTISASCLAVGRLPLSSPGSFDCNS